MYPALKTFFHEAYGQCLTAMALCSTSGQNGYATQNMYNVLEGNNNTDEDMVTTITQTAAATKPMGATPPRWASHQCRHYRSTSYWQTKQPSCCRWGQCHLHRPQPNTLTSMCRATCSKCCPSRSWPYPCSNTFQQVTSTQEVGGIRAAKAMEVDGTDEGVTHLRTTCKPQEPCRLYLANSSPMEEA
jgi:hypothetical protein